MHDCTPLNADLLDELQELLHQCLARSRLVAVGEVRQLGRERQRVNARWLDREGLESGLARLLETRRACERRGEVLSEPPFESS